MKRIPSLLTLALLSVSTGCPTSEASPVVPMPHGPSTDEPGFDTVPVQPPSPGAATDNPAPLNNDDRLNPHDPAQEQGGGSHAGNLTPTP